MRVRINLMESLRGPAMVLRLIPQTILGLEDLQLPEVLKTGGPQGLVLVTGPTGSGKSTTLAAMVDWINRNKPPILTIEDRLIRSRSAARCGSGRWATHPALQAAARCSRRTPT